jgi:predicted aldo/keto reductase-like oxidoreductase
VPNTLDACRITCKYEARSYLVFHRKEDILRTVKFGNTGLFISPLVFGTLPLGILQANVPAVEGGRLIRFALERGVNMIDTARMYGTFGHVREGIRGYTGEVHVASKTHAADAAASRDHVETALKEMNLERLDVLLLHGGRVADPFTERAAVFEEMRRMKEEGIARVIGISSHYVSVIREAAGIPEVDVIHPLINQAGMGVLDGSAEDMAAAIALAASSGKGVYAMKALAGGNFISSARKSISWVKGLAGVHALALGMLSEAEVEANAALLESGSAPDEVWAPLEKGRRSLIIMREFCIGCGACIEVCKEGALSMVEGAASVDPAICVLCGYCGAACPQFIIRVT